MKHVMGCLASVAYFAVMGVTMVGSMIGDCFPELGKPRPTDHQRFMRVLAVLVCGCGLYLVVGLLIFRSEQRRERDDR